MSIIMLRSLGIAALTLFSCFSGTARAGETVMSSGPPVWKDGASVYLQEHDSPTTTPENQPEARDARRLPLPSSMASVRTANSDSPGRNTSDVRRAADFSMPLNTIYTLVCALLVTIGAFLLCAWLLRRGNRIAAQSLPKEVVTVLGRVPLQSRQFAQLLRVGNKLVLISSTPSGPETLTEVTDPVEVDRIVGLCQQSQPHSTTKAFEQVFQQLSREPAPSGFLGSTLSKTATVPSLDMFRSQPGEAARV